MNIAHSLDLHECHVLLFSYLFSDNYNCPHCNILHWKEECIHKVHHSRILNFRYIIQRTLSHYRLQMIFLNLCEFFSLRSISMLMERSFGSTELHIFNRTFDHTIIQYLSSPSMSNSIESSSILWMQQRSISFEY